MVEEGIISGLYARTSGLGPHASGFCPMLPPGACYVDGSNVKTADFSREVAFIRHNSAGIADFRHVSADNDNVCRWSAAIASFGRSRDVVDINRFRHKAEGVKKKNYRRSVTERVLWNDHRICLDKFTAQSTYFTVRGQSYFSRLPKY